MLHGWALDLPIITRSKFDCEERYYEVGASLELDFALQDGLLERQARDREHEPAPRTPRSALAVKGRFEPAPRPVTVAEPSSTAMGPRTSNEVMSPVTYITLVSKLPLPGEPAGTLGARARMSRRPRPPG